MAGLVDESGEVVEAYAYDAYGKVRMYRVEGQVADADQDGDVDISDFECLQRCFGGAGNPIPTECTTEEIGQLDFDGDDDIDEDDMADFLGCWQGPNWAIRATGDYNEDGFVDAEDVDEFILCTQKSLPQDPQCDAFDFDGNGAIDLYDYGTLAGLVGYPAGTPWAGCVVPQSASQLGNPHYFTGQRLDLIEREILTVTSAAQLYHYRARWYDPEHGRFGQRDPAGYTSSANLLEAFQTNPTRFSDPLGLFTVSQLVGRKGEVLLIKALQKSADHIILHGVGKSTAAKGPDLIAYNTKSNVFEFYDNKAWRRANTAYTAPKWMQRFNLSDYETILRSAIDNGNVPSHLKSTYTMALDSAIKRPSTVRRIKTPLGGNLRGIGSKLITDGIDFMSKRELAGLGGAAGRRAAICSIPIAGIALEVLANTSVANAATIDPPEIAVYKSFERDIYEYLERIRTANRRNQGNERWSEENRRIGQIHDTFKTTRILRYRTGTIDPTTGIEELYWAENLSDEGFDFVNGQIGMDERLEKMQTRLEYYGVSELSEWGSIP